jgi:hypothetical protein
MRKRNEPLISGLTVSFKWVFLLSLGTPNRGSAVPGVSLS